MRFKKYLYESGNLKGYIKSMLKLFDVQDVNEKQVAFYKWMDKQAKSLKCKSYKSDPALKSLIEKNIEFDSPKVKECYRNSWMIAATNSREIEVVGGYTAAMGIPIEHAWNFYKPKKIHFDLTAEICLNKKVESEEYLQIVKMKASDATKIMSNREFEIMGLLGSWYYNKVNRSK